MHIKRILAEADRSDRPSFSFEFFPPKTEQGVQNLYDRMDRMHHLGPKFIDITWGAGGSSADLTCEMVAQAQSVHGLETCMHLTCTDMGRDRVDDALHRAFLAGCVNILALRGDPPRDADNWLPAPDSEYRYARDLVTHIRTQYVDHFDIGVAGYPEGCDDNRDEDLLLDHLREKVDAGASFIITQMFYDVDNFLRWVGRVRERGISVPILPGIMPIATYASFLRRARHMHATIPPHWMAALEPVKNDDVAVRDVGKALVGEMCSRILTDPVARIRHLHFYTMNLLQPTQMVLDHLDWLPAPGRPLAHPLLPWKQSKGPARQNEDVRPIFWRNRHRSYILRTQDWDEFPNGRWGDSRSPAFGELDAYGIRLSGSSKANRLRWGEPSSLRDVATTFTRYLRGDLDALPWSESPLTAESSVICNELVALNERGLLTINSQPAVPGVRSTHPVHGWGPANGYVFQKAYLELLVPPNVFAVLADRLAHHPDLTYYAVTRTGGLLPRRPTDGPNAVTWGVFPGKEIVQPTIVESISFLAWKDEAFSLGLDWAHCHVADSPSRRLIEGIMNEWYLVNIVNNDFHQQDTIFRLFDDLAASDIDRQLEPAIVLTKSNDPPPPPPSQLSASPAGVHSNNNDATLSAVSSS